MTHTADTCMGHKSQEGRHNPMTNEKDNTLMEYAHAMVCAALAEQRLRGGSGVPSAYVGDTETYDQLAHMFHASVRQQQRTESLRVLEFDAKGVRWIHGVPR